MTDISLHNEKELLLQIASGDAKAFGTLFEIYHPNVYQASLLATRSPEISEEVVQDVFLQLWIERERLPLIRDFKSYFFIVARNRAYRAMRKQVRFEEVGEQLTEDLMANPVDEQHTTELLTLINQGIKQLPPQQQQVFTLSKLEGKKRDEVAAIMNISPETVKKYLALATLSIRSWCMKNYPPGLSSFLIFLLLKK